VRSVSIDSAHTHLPDRGWAQLERWELVRQASGSVAGREMLRKAFPETADWNGDAWSLIAAWNHSMSLWDVVRILFSLHVPRYSQRAQLPFLSKTPRWDGSSILLEQKDGRARRALVQLWSLLTHAPSDYTEFEFECGSAGNGCGESDSATHARGIALVGVPAMLGGERDGVLHAAAMLDLPTIRLVQEDGVRVCACVCGWARPHSSDRSVWEDTCDLGTRCLGPGAAFFMARPPQGPELGVSLVKCAHLSVSTQDANDALSLPLAAAHIISDSKGTRTVLRGLATGTSIQQLFSLVVNGSRGAVHELATEEELPRDGFVVVGPAGVTRCDGSVIADDARAGAVCGKDVHQCVP
jgi:hypothetical protein